MKGRNRNVLGHFKRWLLAWVVISAPLALMAFPSNGQAANDDSASPGTGNAINQAKGNQKMNQSELEARGKKLRQMLEPYIARANGDVNWNFNIILNDEAYEFFPKGMLFDDAIVVLNAAGFHVIPRPTPREKFKYWQFASLVFPNRYIYKTNIGVQLEPDTPRLDDVRVKSAVITIGVN